MHFKRLCIGMVFVFLLAGCHAAPPFSESTAVLNMPECIEITVHGYDEHYILRIQGNGEKALTYYKDDELVKRTDLSQEQIVELNTLYASIHNFANGPMIEEGNVDTRLIENGRSYEFLYVLTEQVELEQYICLLRSYYSGSIYDWRVAQCDGYARFNERSLVSAYKDMSDWASLSREVQLTDLPITEDLTAAEALDGNVYQYFAAYGMGYVRKDGDRYYACYRSEDELLTVWFDRQGTKVGTERKLLE